MKQIIIPLAIIFGIAVIGFTYFTVVAVRGKSSGNIINTKLSGNQEMPTETEKLADLVNMDNQTCEIDTENITATIKIKGRKTNSTVTYKSNLKTYKTIIAGNTMYTWEQGTTNGAKIVKDGDKPALQKEFTNALKPFFESADLKCTSTQISEVEFTPPNEMNFIDINSLVK
ncbi:hypothetical protein GW755_00975 [bacterium]|nr:hypothetical protein [bacterium]